VAGGFFLLALPALMARSGKELAVLMLAHLFSSFLYDTSQQITPNP
jgi:hypothetical protein